MNLSDVFSITFSILGFIAVCIAYWLMAAGLFPGFVARAADQFGKAPAKLGVLGLVTFVPLVFLALTASGKANNALAKVLAIGVALSPMLAALFGSAGLALRVGAGLKSARDEAEPWRRVLRGGIVVGLAFVLPFVGTFLILPYTLIAGFGAFLVCLRRPRPAMEEAPAPVLVAAPVTVPAP
jgi:hypothetical protein